jgi:hypothetical protein
MKIEKLENQIKNKEKIIKVGKKYAIRSSPAWPK